MQPAATLEQIDQDVIDSHDFKQTLPVVMRNYKKYNLISERLTGLQEYVSELQNENIGSATQ